MDHDAMLADFRRFKDRFGPMLERLHLEYEKMLKREKERRDELTGLIMANAGHPPLTGNEPIEQLEEILDNERQRVANEAERLEAEGKAREEAETKAREEAEALAARGNDQLEGGSSQGGGEAQKAKQSESEHSKSGRQHPKHSKG
jgi:hypothetical protein